MGAETKIEWCDATFNPWMGCEKVSSACDHCYAETLMKRVGKPELWRGERRRTSVENWRMPVRWNAAAARDGERARIFCASLADVFDNQVPVEWRRDLYRLIRATPHLDWLLLTKRPQNIPKMAPPSHGIMKPFPWPNIWLGATVENQEEADRRIPRLLAVPAAKHFLSCEPLLGPIDLHRLYSEIPLDGGGLEQRWDSCLTGRRFSPWLGSMEAAPRIDWLIAGGETGHHARPTHPAWFRSLRDQCKSAGVPFFMKQHGDWVDYTQIPGRPNNWVNADPRGTSKLRGRIYRCERDGKSRLPGNVFFDGEAFETTMPFRAGEDPGPLMVRVGKARAGALLDGVECREFPAARTEIPGTRIETRLP